MRKTYLYMTAVAMSAALAAGCQKAEPAETTAAAETVAESTGTGMAESESSETSGTAAQDDERLADYHLLQGIVTGTNDEKGTFTLKADDGGEYVITILWEGKEYKIIRNPFDNEKEVREMLNFYSTENSKWIAR